MKYVLMIQATGAGWRSVWPVSSRSGCADLVEDLDEHLRASGELVCVEYLAGPDQAKVVRARRDGHHDVLAAPFPPNKEFLARFWIIDCDGPERAQEIAVHLSASLGPDGAPGIPGGAQTADENPGRRNVTIVNPKSKNERERKKEYTMKYMLMMNATKADWGGFGTLSPEEIGAHIRFMKDLNKDLKASGEMVDAQGLTGPEDAKVVRAGKNGAPVVTDGPFPEAKEFLAGYWILDVKGPERIFEIAARISTAPGRGGQPMTIPVEVRPVGSAPDV